MKIEITKFKNKKILFITFLLLMNCVDKKEKDLLEFSPEMITKLDLNQTDGVVLEEYCNNKRNFSESVKFEYKSKVDTDFSEFKSAKYKFKLRKKLNLDCNYRLTIDVKNKKYFYFFQNFDYDTVCSGNSISHAIDSYFLNGKKRYYRNSKYYLD
ncbi:hypothetical protein ACQ9BO_05560 [Flavobacterium sp. P21]|uniref:hypothetical protein n=1 Tax=Flavobacterium sp. P21 TaxID=3423948 RepID=UPI003D663BE0